MLRVVDRSLRSRIVLVRAGRGLCQAAAHSRGGKIRSEAVTASAALEEIPPPPSSPPPASFDVVVVGAGAGGLAAAGRIAKKLWILRRKRVAVIEPNEQHEYKAAWTALAGGLKTKPRDMARPLDQHRNKWTRFLPFTKGILSRRLEWIQAGVQEFDPERNTVVTTAGQEVWFDPPSTGTHAQYRLSDAVPAQADWGAVDGLEDALLSSAQGGTQGAVVCSSHSRDFAEATRELVAHQRAGVAIFAHPRSQRANPGPTHSMAMLAQEQWADRPVELKVYTGADDLMACGKYADTVETRLAERGIEVRTDYHLAAVRPESREADFLWRHPNWNTLLTETVNFDFMHVTPSLAPVPALAKSPLVNHEGLVDVNERTLRHTAYDNVFAIGDCASVPVHGVSAGAALSQARVAAQNILSSPMRTLLLDVLMPSVDDQQDKDEKERMKNDRDELYWGYTVSPVHTSKKTLLLAETDYQQEPCETFILDQYRDGRLWKWLFSSMLPRFYWKRTVYGKWWAMGPHSTRSVQLADSPWKYILCKYHPTEKQPE